MLAALVSRTHSRFNLTVMTVEKVAMEVMEVTEAMAIKVFLRGARWLIASSVHGCGGRGGDGGRTGTPGRGA